MRAFTLISAVILALSGGTLRCADFTLPDDPCLVVRGDRILASDLARIDKAFQSLSPELSFGYAPMPGATRAVPAQQLQRFATRHGVVDFRAGFESVCFERPMEALSEERLIQSLREALGDPRARIEVVDFTRDRIPIGRLRFERSGLYIPPGSAKDAVLVWRGAVEYGTRRTFKVFAKVRITKTRQQVVAVRDLRAGEVIQASDLSEEVTEGTPLRETPLSTLDDAVGVVPRRTINAGEPLLASWLRMPEDIAAGDVVRVEVVSGRTRLNFEAKAVTPGQIGEQISVRNPGNGRMFKALVEAKGRVRVHAGGVSED
jgi:flagella basal body P-ring formation protein FlgA